MSKMTSPNPAAALAAVTLVTVTALATALTASQQVAPDLLARVQAFATQYQRDAPSLVAEERYLQNITYSEADTRGTSWSGNPAPPVTKGREMTSELVMVRLAGSSGWVSLRDVLTVDKRRIRDREERLLNLLRSPDPSAFAQASKLAEESARFNLGRVRRTMNVPDIALEYLQPQHAARIVFEAPRKDSIDGVSVVAFRFRERIGPSIIRDAAGGDLLANGRVWADPESGAIVRTELILRDRVSTGTCTVEFRIEPRLAIRVPMKMTERYVARGEDISAVATYSNFRSFAVSTTEKVTKPPGELFR
jgi:hypothetical protein